MKSRLPRFLARTMSLVLSLCFLFSACEKTTDTPLSSDTTLSSDKAITAFSFASPAATGTIDESAKTIAVSLPAGTAVTALVATFTTTGASVKVGAAAQASGATANDFTSPVTYTVTAADGSTASYVVTVTVAAARSSAKAITSFAFLAADNPGILSADVAGTIDDSVKNIHMSFPAGTSTTALKPSIVVSSGATISPTSLAATNFSSTVIYTVTAADGSTQAYSVCAFNQPTSPEMLWNGDFSYYFDNGRQSANWVFWQNTGGASSFNFSSKACVLSGSARGSNEASVCIGQQSLNLVQYGIYQLQFDASSTNPSDAIEAHIQENGVDINGDGGPWTTWSGQHFTLGTTTNTYSATFMMPNFDDPEGGFTFALGKNTSGTITIDNVSLKADGAFTPPTGGEMVWNGDFSVGQNFWSNWNNASRGTATSYSYTGGQFSLAVDGLGISDWDVLQSTINKNLTKGQKYTVSFDAASTSTADGIVVVISENGVDVNGDGNNTTTWGNYSFAITTTTRTTYSYTFTMDPTVDDNEAKLIFIISGAASNTGGATASTGTVTIDNVSMKPTL
jgi:hypothetical protein